VYHDRDCRAPVFFRYHTLLTRVKTNYESEIPNYYKLILRFLFSLVSFLKMIESLLIFNRIRIHNLMNDYNH